MERANEDSQLEGLKVLPPQDVEQVGVDKLHNETASQAGIKKRRLGGACEDLSV